MGLENLLQEILQSGVTGVTKDLFRSAFLDDFAVSHEQHAVTNFTGEAHFVGNNHHGHATLCQFLHNVQNFADHFGEVGSSKSMTSGSIISARTMAIRCF